MGLWLRTTHPTLGMAGKWHKWKMCKHCGKVPTQRIVEGVDKEAEGCVPGYILSNEKKLCYGGVCRVPGAESTRVVTRRWKVWTNCLARGWGTMEQRRDLQKAVKLLEGAHGRAKAVFDKVAERDNNGGGSP